ncbi:MAG TPA: nucleotidyl transferase AbiEii/AbiGii toxin family protein [Bryobacteraceae bacterium]
MRAIIEKMRARAFWKAVTVDHSDFLDSLIALLAEGGIRYCVIGGQAVNAYVEPLVSLDLDLVVAVDQMAGAEAMLRERFKVERFPHSLNVESAGSDLRVQIRTDPRYFAFVDRADSREVLGVTLPVAALEDVLQGKIWAASDPRRRPSTRRKDLLDIERILESQPSLRALVPATILDRLA